MKFNIKKCNLDTCEYGEFRDECYSSFHLRPVNVETQEPTYYEATSYIESARSGRGREAFDALEFMLREKAQLIGHIIRHTICNIANNPKIDHMATKSGYSFIGFKVKPSTKNTFMQVLMNFS